MLQGTKETGFQEEILTECLDWKSLLVLDNKMEAHTAKQEKGKKKKLLDCMIQASIGKSKIQSQWELIATILPFPPYSPFPFFVGQDSNLGHTAYTS